MQPRQLSLPGRRKPYIMAHRGNQVACPENTLAAFRRALADGADILETDLHLSADGEFVCIHDPTLERTTDGRGPVAGLTLAQLKDLSASCGRPEFRAERIPTLRETAALLPGDRALGLELKTDRFLEHGVCRRLGRELAEAGVRRRTVALSFSLSRLTALRAAAPDIPAGWISLTRAWPIRETEILGPFWPILLLNPFFVRVAHLRRQLVCPLDPQPEPRLRLYRWLKCDAVISNDPARTARALGRASPPGPNRRNP